MSRHVQWVLELAVADGKLADLRTLAAEMTAATRDNEPGALAYEWFLSEDGKTCHLYERYADSDATMVHLENVKAQFLDRLFALAKPAGLTVYGAPDDRAREALEGLRATLLAPMAGFTR